MRRFAAAAALACSLAALSSPAAPAAAGGCSAGPGGHLVRTSHYVFVIKLGTYEDMVSAAEAKAKHLKKGEVMVRGEMTGMQMAMGGQSHLEVAICSRSTGKRIADARPAITISDLTAKPKTTKVVPVAVMYGVAEGPSDIHYGNNVELKPGHRYLVTVVLKGELATATIEGPGAHM